jgi:RNA polymerase sigma-70 factor, ECF subfamily
LKSWIELALPDAVAYASSLLGDRTQGEDVVQDCVCRLLGHAARYDLARDGRKLLFRAITNACINRQTRDRKLISLDTYGRQDEGAWELEDAEAHTPLVMAMAEELRSAIAQGLHTLPLRQRSALELSSLGYPAEEIAEMLEVRGENVRVLLFRARQAMAIFLNTRFSGGVPQ